jgi:prolyl oligopeptidase
MTKRNIFIFLWVSLFWFGGVNDCYLHGTDVYHPLKLELRQKLDELTKTMGFPGVTLGIVLPDNNEISLASGLSDLESKTPMAPTDHMFSGSIGKTYAAVVALQLMKEKKFSLDDKISTFFGKEKWFPRLPNGNDITVRMLMSHTGGLPRYVLKEAVWKTAATDLEKVWTPVERLSYIFDDPPQHPAGKGWAYSDTDFILVGMIIEKVTGNTYYRELMRRVLKPHGLDATSPADKRRIKGLIPGYTGDKTPPFHLPGKMVQDGLYMINPQLEWTGGGLVTHATDLARFVKLLIEGKLLAPESLSLMKAAVDEKTGKPAKAGYGLGLEVWDTPHGISYGHRGIMPGYLSIMEYLPDYGFSIALQVNSDGFSGKLAKGKNRGDYIAPLKAIVIKHLSLLTTREDPYFWLEDIHGEKSMAWVNKQNKASTARLESVPGFKEINRRILDVANSSRRIPYGDTKGGYLYNFWRGRAHARGVLRRTTMEEYRKEQPAWETILDIDALSKLEKENWVYKGIEHLYPGYDRCLVTLSRGGTDAAVIREFDIPTRSFVKDGFYVPEAKSNAAWIDKDTIFVSADFGKGSLTKGGYARIVKVWKRGTPLKEAKTVFEAKEDSLAVFGTRMFSAGGHVDMIIDYRSFYKSGYYILKNNKPLKLDIPPDAELNGYFKKHILLWLKSDWNTGETTFKKGSVIAGKPADVLAGEKRFRLLMEPGPRLSVAAMDTTKNKVLITVLDNVISKLYAFTLESGGTWSKQEVKVGEKGTLRVSNASEERDDYFVNFENFLTPDSLYLVSGQTGKLEKLKSQPHFFDAGPYTVDQWEAVSKDGTRAPYFIVKRKDTVLNGKNPTLLHGYGGFLVPMRPQYSAVIGMAWLEKGGIYVKANIRGGGEFGPEWHRAALKKNRHKAFEDFIAIAEDLIKRKITSPAKLAIRGGSNGGLLVGAVMVKRPDLFNAVVCRSPLLDMKRFHKLLAGANGIAEYGNPDDPVMWNYIKTYSPYHNVKKGVTYPAVFFTTSTRDDRVHPGHARKMAAKMMAMGQPVYFYERTQGGHTSSVNNREIVYMAAIMYAFLYKMLMNK